MTLIAFTAILAVAIVVSGMLGGGDESRTSRSPTSPPRREDFSNERDYAVASARYSLSGDHMELLSTPECIVTSAAWTCTAKARTDLGPYAGLVLTYRCRSIESEQPGGAPPGNAILCGPADPPPLPTLG
jgi:hypothetical protein